MRDAIKSALSGDCIVYPTTTQPALGCIPTPESLDKLYHLKNRDHSIPVSIGVADLKQAEAQVEVPDLVRSLLGDFPRGSLTVVLKAHETLDSRLGGDGIAIRVVAHPEAIKLLNAVGPLTATSANHSGFTPVTNCEEAARILSSSDEEIAFVPGSCPGGPPSTLIAWYSVCGSTQLRDTEVLREGVVPSKEVRTWLRRRT
ncbi:MAG: L-threonylcarbamoyladenylate synthase [Candidatus Thermoplasmatota archaeon]|nr:L-threonylcarbamoyladenylate synthase [Candidatus Thermoplasmatota archaeon]